MAYEKQRSVAAEVDNRFPKDRGNMDQQKARMIYNARLLHGEAPEVALRHTLADAPRSKPNLP